MRTLVVLIIAASLHAQEPTPEQLVERLGHKSFAEREKATKALRDLGPPALPAVRKGLEHKDEEVRTRVAALLPAMEIAEALLPTRITLSASDKPMSEILKELEKQVKDAQFVAKLPAEQRTIEFKNTPYWEAMRKLPSADNTVTVSLKQDPNRYRNNDLPQLSASPAFALDRGPIRLEMTWLHEDRDIDLGKSKEGVRDGKLTLSIALLAEPRITFLKIDPARVTEAVDDEGRSLLEPAPEKATTDGKKPVRPYRQMVAAPRGTFRGESLRWSDVRLKAPADGAKSIKVVRGMIPVKVILMRKDLVVSTDILKSGGTRIKAGNDTLQVTKIEDQGGNQFQIELSVPNDQDADGNWQNRVEWNDRFTVTDDAGNRYQSRGSGGRSNGKERWITLYFGPPFNKKDVGPPTKLIFEDWIVHEFEVRFEFKDVPLPR